MDELRKKKGFICDMDGVIYHGNRLLPGVKEFVDWLYAEKKHFLVPDQLVGALPEGTAAEAERAWAWMWMRATSTPARWPRRGSSASQAPGCSAYVIGGAGLIMALHDEGITMNDVDPDYVIIGEGNYLQLRKHFEGRAAGDSRAQS